MDRTPKLPLILALLGGVPFVAQLLSFVLQLSDASFTLQLAAMNYYTIHVVLIYAFAILFFMFGIDWGLAIGSGDHSVSNGLLLFSVAGFVCTMVMLSFLFYNKTIFIVLAGAYAALWLADIYIHKKALCPTWYMRIRHTISPIAIVCLIGLQSMVNYIKI